MHMMVQRPIRFNSPPLEVYTKIQSEVAERAQRGKKGNSYRKPTEVVGCLLIASDGSVGAQLTQQSGRRRRSPQASRRRQKVETARAAGRSAGAADGGIGFR
jgi:hypothetical protein